MSECGVNVPVLLIFWERPDVLRETFNAIKQARPSTLLLWQDGPRGEAGVKDIEECRKIVEDIDWDCKVYRMYNEVNYGCDPSTFYAHKWAFSIVDRCIVLEDDVVPSQSFFRFCEEMLEKYKEDTRINKICGMNQVKTLKCEDSYLFSSVSSVWGWATWKRVAETWDEEYAFLQDEKAMRLLEQTRKDKAYKNYLLVCKQHKKSGRAHWETIQTFSRNLNSQINIIPAKNLIHNIGLGNKSTHSNTQLNCLPKAVREAFYCDSQELEFPLKHPKYVIEDHDYKKKLFKIIGKNNPLKRFLFRIEGVFLRIKHIGLRKTLARIFKKK